MRARRRAPRAELGGYSRELPGWEDFGTRDHTWCPPTPITPQYTGPGPLGVPGAPARGPATVDPVHLPRDEAASVPHLSPPRNLLGSRARGWTTKPGPAPACHPAQVHGDGAPDTLFSIQAQMLCHFRGQRP